jgi:hypothetical protein
MHGRGEECWVGVRHSSFRRAAPPGLSAEKDFVCLDDSDEDNRDMFTDPMKGRVRWLSCSNTSGSPRNRTCLSNGKIRPGRVGVRVAGVVGQVCVAESVGRHGPGAAETVATPGEARPGSAAALVDRRRDLRLRDLVDRSNAYRQLGGC